MAFFFFFFLKLSNNKRWHQWDTGAADSGFVGMLVRRSKWKQHEMDKKPLRLICFENEAALMYRPIAGRLVQRGHNFPHMEGPALDSTMLPSPGNRRARMTSTGKLPSTSAFFFFFFSKLLRFDFNALCSFVFSCKNLTVLECLYFIKCV